MTGRRGRSLLPRLAAALLLSGALCAGAGLGWLDLWDGAASDALYQRPAAADGAVTVIGMDQLSLEELGPLPWPRSVMAEVVDRLNAQPEARPAVIGIDVLYAGESADPQADAALAEAAARGGNVVTASLAEFGSALVAEGDRFYMDTGRALWVEYPYDALAAVSASGHVNAMSDPDGILRHGLLYVDWAGEREYSFARTVYEAWCAARGEAPTPLPAAEDGVYYAPLSVGPGGYYEGVSVADILGDSFDPAYYQGKIVLIGPYAPAMQDSYRTAIDRGGDMYGVEFQANLIDAFRTGRSLQEAPEGAQLALLFFLCFGGTLFFWDRRLRWALPVWAAACGGWIGLCAALFRLGWVLHVLWVPLGLSLQLVVSLALGYLRYRREQRKITSIFGRYVDPAILRTLTEIGGDELELGGKNYEIAVLFVDIRGFTAMSESLAPAQVVEIINQYLSLTTDCVMRYHGTLDKFVGDCTMAFWNAPVHQPDAVYLACRAAMDMVAGSEALGQRLLEQYGRTVSFGVGVHMGPAVIGNIGSPKHMDYTAIGDTVNTASRLESNAPGGKIFISRAVAEALGDRAETTSLGSSIRLKGKSEGFEVLTLDRLRADSGDAAPQPKPGPRRRPGPRPRPAGVWRCPDCGARNRSRFCPDCGRKRPEGAENG